MNILALLTLTAALAPADTLPAAPLPKLGAAVEMAHQLFTLADQASARHSPPEVRLPGSSSLEAIQLRVIYRIPNLTIDGYRTNEVLGTEVPGRHISVSIRVDVLVHFILDVQKMQLRQDPDYADSCELVLPRPTVTTEFPDNELADYIVEYGALHVPYFSQDLARELRAGLYSKGRDKAQARFRQEVEPALRDDTVRELQKVLRQHFPKKRIYVRIGS